ncbi:hypothetical protein U1872_22185, partial [Sphingomonas sp. RB3P16]
AKFNCFAYVASPRDAYPIRSELLFTLLRQFREAGIEVGSTATKMELVGSLPGSPVADPNAGPNLGQNRA